VLTGRSEVTQVIRPSAILDEKSAAQILAALARNDVSRGGAWNATSALWQRYDKPWQGPGGSRGDAALVGSIGVMYDAPARHQITIYKVSISALGVSLGWSVDSLCDDALSYVGLTLARCPRAQLAAPPVADPFHRARTQG
jgi:hypothetical protein